MRRDATVQSISPLLAWFFAFILILLAGRAAVRLALARGEPVRHPLTPAERNRELQHAAMGLGMAALLVPGLPRPPQTVSVCFFAVLAALAAADWARRLLARRHGGAEAGCGPAEGGRLLDPHHAIVGLAMVAMLLQPTGNGAGGAGAGGVGAVGGAAASGGAPMQGMAGMTMGGSPNAPILLLLGYVWIAALVLGYGMTRVLAASGPGSGAGSGSGSGPGSGATLTLQPQYAGTAGAVLSAPSTVYACELAMTVLTGLMLLN
jgi:hypothetical protein